MERAIKKGVFLAVVLIVFLGVIIEAEALSVTLTSPANSAVYVDSRTVTFKCKAIGKDLVSLRLYSDTSGSWALNATQMYPANNTDVSFTVSKIANGNYNWNCKAIDGLEGIKFASANRSFSIDIPGNSAPVFSGSIANQSWDENTAKTSAFDLDNYFSDVNGDTLTYSSSGSSNINVQIGSGNIVSFSQPSEWFGIENIRFIASDGKGGSANSNYIRLKVNQVNATIPAIPSNATNNAPTITPVIPNQTSFLEDGNWSIDLSNYASDKEDNDDGLNWSYSGVDTSLFKAEINNYNKKITFSPQGKTGSDEFTLTVTDKNGATDSQKVSVIISEGIEEDIVATIVSKKPYGKYVNLREGDNQEFLINASGYDDIKWYLDNERQDSSEVDYSYENVSAGTHNVTVIISGVDSRDSNTWSVIVLKSGEEEIISVTTAAVLDLNFSLENIKDFEKSVGEEIKFELNGSTHKITIEEINESSLMILIESDPLRVILGLNERKKIDVNEDGAFDIIVGYNGVRDGIANLRVEKVSESWLAWFELGSLNWWRILKIAGYVILGLALLFGIFIAVIRLSRWRRKTKISIKPLRGQMKLHDFKKKEEGNSSEKKINSVKEEEMVESVKRKIDLSEFGK